MLSLNKENIKWFQMFRETQSSGVGSTGQTRAKSQIPILNGTKLELKWELFIKLQQD